MSPASFDYVQSWLSNELELLGIDSVVYSRHILNLFMNSHFTTDVHLAKKEANIFAKLYPGPSKTKPKHKGRKKSSSSPFSDEVALKKEMAANCLEEALDEAIQENRKKMETLIDDLYIKLHSLNLLSGSSSDSDERRVGKTKEKRRESYHDAFPLLLAAPDKEESIERSRYLDTVWNGQNVFKKIQITKDPTENKITEKNKTTHSRPGFNPKSNNADGFPQQAKLKGKSKKINNPRKCSKRRSHPFDLAKKSAVNGRYKGTQQRAKDKFGFNKENSHEPQHYCKPALQRKKPTEQPSSFNKTRIADKKAKQINSNIQVRSKSFFDNAGATISSGYRYPHHYSSVLTGLSHVASETNSSNENAISHLYSIGLPDFCDKLCWSEDAPTSKWFRDPQSGCLEFEPAYKSLSSPDASPSSLESWVWCPSPSLWDDDDDSLSPVAQSRFETVYKQPLRHASLDSQVCQRWKDYEAIFTDVAESSAVHEMAKKSSCSDIKELECKAQVDDELLDALNCSWQPVKVSTDSGECLFDFSGCFSTSPSPPPTQSRKEIWLKNAKSPNSNDPDVFIFEDCFDSTNFRSSFHQWVFGYDLPEEVVDKQPQFSMPPFVSLPLFSWSYHQFTDVLTNVSAIEKLGCCEFVRSLSDQCCYKEEDNLLLSERVCSSKLNQTPPVSTVVCQSQKYDSASSDTSLLEQCVTDNQSWKSSLRVTNMWQSISGIRQVNVLYSDKQADSNAAPKLQPSSCTHFRPIHESDLDVSDVSIASTLQDHFLSDTAEGPQTGKDDLVFFFSTPKKQHASCDGCSDCDMKIRGLEQDLDNLLFDSSPKTSPTCKKSLLSRFRKAGNDKSMQTSFEEHIRQIDSDLCGSFAARPPKANSR